MAGHDRYVKALSRFVGDAKDRPEYREVMPFGGHLYATNGIICARADVGMPAEYEIAAVRAIICRRIDTVVSNLYQDHEMPLHADFNQLAKVAKAWRDIHGGRGVCGARLYPCRDGLARIDMRCESFVVAIRGMEKI